jgi:phosphoenolpyruvate carboxykinase (ATP)
LIDLSLKTVLLKTKFGGESEYPFEPAAFEALKKVTSYLSIFIRDSYVCADPNYRLNVRVLTETPWANLFCYNMFLRPEQQELENFTPEWTLLCVPSFQTLQLMVHKAILPY